VALHKKSDGPQTPLLSRGGESRGEASTGVVLAKEINILTTTTPALRATPPRLRRGACSSDSTFCAKPEPGHLAPYVKSSNSVTLSALVQTPSLPAWSGLRSPYFPRTPPSLWPGPYAQLSSCGKPVKSS